MLLEIPAAIKQKSNKILTNSNINLNEDVEVNLQTCLEMKQLTHILKKLRHLSDDTLETNLNDSELPNLQYRLNQCKKVVSNELFPTWEIRDTILNQCKEELSNYKQRLDQSHNSNSANDKTMIMDSNNNLDPYSKRDLVKKTTSYYVDYNASTKWLEQQIGVENIIREKSVVTLKNNCNDNIEYMKQFNLFCKKK
ncbi:hypothetical protein HANVADRAFT_4731 [Hanseniaspora valbyensis NRRL Y-1626]|uniref:Uncharacterized protein n=1 Tax=Hanseniaspora valbyensis NRRL Y-1626 TaxID=766949 RepID=A0A1B7TJY7_9ASCO|nr:hypothetical protein HANVADRAFT_4731 [Hanseniaspora valbyensis NRRL Y-1626]